MYNVIFDVLEEAEGRLKRKQICWKRQMLEAVQAALNKLQKYYGDTRERFGDLYGVAILLSPSTKRLWNKKHWKDDEAEYYWAVFEKIWKARYAARRPVPPVEEGNTGMGLDLQEFLCPSSQALEQESDPEDSELSRYRMGRFEAIGKTHKHNALAVWKVIGPDFPSIAQMARDILSIPAASVGVERTFSIARHQMRYNRKYSPKMFETIMMTGHGLDSRTLQENREIEAEMLSGLSGLSGQPVLDEY